MEQGKFDNQYYYELYPDVKDAVMNKKWFKDGEHHYNVHGKKEGREARFLDQGGTVIEKDIVNEIEAKNQGWSNHLTLKGDQYKEVKTENIPLNKEVIPDVFKPVQMLQYPSGNDMPFERYFEKKFDEMKPQTFRTYIPIHWTAYYVNNKYGTDTFALKKLQDELDKLPRNKKYFTVIQYDDGILNNLRGLDLLVYSMGCNKKGYYPIPLISSPLNNTPSEIPTYKDILYSFHGAETHKIRTELVNTLKNEGLASKEYVTFDVLNIKDYYDVLKRSIFVLSPRGYGITSFRMYEAMHYGCIPVYISDKFWEPFNLPFDYGIKIKPNQIKDIRSILANANIEDMQRKLNCVYENYFVYSSCYHNIIKTLTV